MFTNVALREINLKFVYYGPGLGGKTTNIRFLHESAPTKSEMMTLATEADRTLFFDFMPMEVGTVNDFKVRLHLYTVPGQVFYEATRRLVVAGADGIVLVADSQEERMDANVESLAGLQENLAAHGMALRDMPYVVQCNKRDLPRIVPVGEMRAALDFKGEPFIEAVASSGEGVRDTLRTLTRQVMTQLRESNRLACALASTATPPPPPAVR